MPLNASEDITDARARIGYFISSTGIRCQQSRLINALIRFDTNSITNIVLFVKQKNKKKRFST